MERKKAASTIVCDAEGGYKASFMRFELHPLAAEGVVHVSPTYTFAIDAIHNTKKSDF